MTWSHEFQQVGMMLVAINASDFRSIRTDLKGRGMGSMAPLAARADTITSNYSGATAFSVVYGSSYNVFNNVALHNHHQILWLASAIYNTYNGVAARTDAGEILLVKIFTSAISTEEQRSRREPNYRGIYIQSDTPAH